MNPKINQLLTSLNEQIHFLNLEIDNPILKCEKAIEIILGSIANLRKIISKSNFKTDTEEIHFFKDVKPQFSSKLIYYNMVYKIEMKRPNGGNRILKKYYNNELLKLKAFFDNELDFYQYYRSGSTYLDYKYFQRGKFDIKMSIDSYYFEADTEFSTSHDFKVAKILANDLIQLYIENQLVMIDNKDNSEKTLRKPNISLNWTSSKVALTELLYALHAEGVFNNGTTEIKDIATYLEYTFNIELGDYYRTFLELRMRKTSRTKFLSSLTDGLIKKMDEADEK